jgi:phosphoglucosamine mutase
MALFGTDGIRDKANSGLLTVENVVRLGKATGKLLLTDPRIFQEQIRFPRAAASVGKNLLPQRRQGHPVVLVGADTRLSSPMLDSALKAGLLSIGIDVLDAGVITTPGVSFLARALNVDLGVVISASHNPMADNGIKYFSCQGLKISDASEIAIERILRNRADGRGNSPVDRNIGATMDFAHGKDLYRRHLLELAGNLRLDGIRIVLDCANGATYEIAPDIFTRLGATVHAIHVSPTGANINLQCGTLHPEIIAADVRRHAAHVGFAFDGDGDRLMPVDETGTTRDGDYVLAIAARHMKKRGLLSRNTVVTTVMSNLGLSRSLAEARIRMRQTQVGDRFVVQEMLRGGFSLGGEQSGHIIFIDHSRTGDGIVTAIMLLKIMAAEDAPLSALSACLKKFPQVLQSVRVRKKLPFDSFSAIRKSIAHVKRNLGKDGRLVLRYSGTEPLARVMLEGHDAAQIKRLAQELCAAIEMELGTSAQGS